jgi:uncharacterized SAM-binding protein YcdF (DUF218 family)
MNDKFDELYNLLLKDEPQKSNAVVWLQGDRFDRAENVLKIYVLGLAKNVIISGNNTLIGPDTRIDENNISLLEMQHYLLINGVYKKDIIIDNKSFNTKGQAVHVIEFAKHKKWRSIILVSSAYNQPRAFLTFLKQIQITGLNLRIYNYPATISSKKIPGGRNTFMDRLCLEENKKIGKYKNDLMAIEFGIKYLNN